MSNATIDVQSMTKAFRLRRDATRTLKSTALGLFRGRAASRRTFKALDDISFSVPAGETLGIIGANGAGKSTLLSLITGTMVPTAGTINVKGTISSLLELGAGFHPDLTGRENVFLSGAIMGLTRRQMQDRFDTIVDFSGIHDFIDQPVKHYSSGMYVRLGFAVAVEVDPDILLIDEVLAVGDTVFQRKCLQRMEEFRERGKTMLIISHDLHTIQSISDRICFLDHGRIEGIGDPEDMVSEYQSLSRRKHAQAMEREWGTGEVTITGVVFKNGAGETADTFAWNDKLTAVISYEAHHRIEQPVFGFSVADKNGRLIYGNNTQIEKHDIPAIDGTGTITLTMDNLLMARGTYLFSFSVHSHDHKNNYHRLDNKFPIAIESEKTFEGCTYLPTHWSR